MVTYRLPFYNIILQLYKCFPSSFGYRIHKIPQRIKAAGVPFPTAFMLCFFYALLLQLSFGFFRHFVLMLLTQLVFRIQCLLLHYFLLLLFLYFLLFEELLSLLFRLPLLLLLFHHLILLI